MSHALVKQFKHFCVNFFSSQSTEFIRSNVKNNEGEIRDYASSNDIVDSRYLSLPILNNAEHKISIQTSQRLVTSINGFSLFYLSDETIMAIRQFQPKGNAFSREHGKHDDKPCPLKVDRSTIQRLISLKILAILRNLFSSLFAGRFLNHRGRTGDDRP